MEKLLFKLSENNGNNSTLKNLYWETGALFCFPKTEKIESVSVMKNAGLEFETEYIVTEVTPDRKKPGGIVCLKKYENETVVGEQIRIEVPSTISLIAQWKKIVTTNVAS